MMICPKCGKEVGDRMLLSFPLMYMRHCLNADCDYEIRATSMEELDRKYNEDCNNAEIQIEKDPLYQQKVIFDLINDALAKRDRYITMFFCADGVNISVYPLTDDKGECEE